MRRKLPVAVAALTVALLTACGSGDGRVTWPSSGSTGAWPQ